MRTQFIPCGILSLADQHFVGLVALEMLLDQMTYLQANSRTVAVREPEFTGHCCTCHVRYPGDPPFFVLGKEVHLRREINDVLQGIPWFIRVNGLRCE
jgi:hypothetical protein